MSPPTHLLGPDAYLWVCALTLAACFVGARLAVKNHKVTLIATLVVLGIYLVRHMLLPEAKSNGVQPGAIALFDTLKSAAVFLPVVIFAFANLKLAQRAREHESTRAREHESVPRWVARFFSGVLCLNLLVAIVPATDALNWHNATYAFIAAGLGLMALQLRWEVKDQLLGFTDKPFTLAYLACLAYLLFFINPPGSGWISFLVLLVAYLPLSRSGHPWIAYRAYSLWIFLCFAHILGLIDFYRSPPAALEQFLLSIRQSAFREGVLLLAVASLAYLVQDRLKERRRVLAQDESPRPLPRI